MDREEKRLKFVELFNAESFPTEAEYDANPELEFMTTIMSVIKLRHKYYSQGEKSTDRTKLDSVMAYADTMYPKIGHAFFNADERLKVRDLVDSKGILEFLNKTSAFNSNDVENAAKFALTVCDTYKECNM